MTVKGGEPALLVQNGDRLTFIAVFADQHQTGSSHEDNLRTKTQALLRNHRNQQSELVYFDVSRGRPPSLKADRWSALPVRKQPYQNEDGKELCFFGQFLFDDMPEADINCRDRLLQIWLLNDQTVGADDYNVRSAETFWLS